MSIQAYALSLSGSRTQRPEDTHQVSLWYIPNGADYVNASVVVYFFSDADSAKTFEAKYSGLPEMAFMTPVQKDTRCVS